MSFFEFVMAHMIVPETPEQVAKKKKAEEEEATAIRRLQDYTSRRKAGKAQEAQATAKKTEQDLPLGLAGGVLATKSAAALDQTPKQQLNAWRASMAEKVKAREAESQERASAPKPTSIVERRSPSPF